MSATLSHCAESQRRRNLVRQINNSRDLNGIEHVEVVCPQPEGEKDKQLLRLHFFADNGLDQLDANKNHVLIRGRRAKPIEVLDTKWKKNEKTLEVSVRGMRNSETYTLQLVKVVGTCRTHEPLPPFDPRYAETQFTWRLEPNTNVDTQPPEIPVGPVRADAEIDYLPRDYASLKRLLLDRLSQIMPEWRERSPADIGITLVELLAWVGDRLTYQQDAVGTEAYLGTARQRISVRRHARLVDYQLHEGCNARVLMQIAVKQDIDDLQLCHLRFCTTPAAEFRLLGKQESMDGRLIEHVPDHQQERFYDTIEVFEPVHKPLREVSLTTDDLIKAASIIDSLGKVGSALQTADTDAGEQASSSATGKLDWNQDMVRVWTELRPSLQTEILELYPIGRNGVSEHLQQQLVEEFNRLITEERLKEHPFDGGLSVQSMALAACHAQDSDFEVQNRVFLDTVFKEELSPIGSKIDLYVAHNEIHFYTWDEDECWLPAGATSATLRDDLVQTATDDPPSAGCDSNSTSKPEQATALNSAAGGRIRDNTNLSVGDILIFEEIKGPKTGNPSDANPDHRHAVRLTRVCKEVDDVPDTSVNVVEIEWSEDDALPFPLCLSSTASEPECCPVRNVSVARGNIILADHGRSVEEPTSIPGGPEPTDRFIVRGEVEQLDCGDRIRRPTRVMTAEPFRPWLSRPNLTFAEVLQRQVPAGKLLEQDVHRTLPSIQLTGIPGNPDGTPRDSGFGRQLANADNAHDLFEDPSAIQSLASLLPPELAYWLAQQKPSVKPADAGVVLTSLRNLAPYYLSLIFRYLLEKSKPQLQECTLRLLQQATRWQPRYDLVDSSRSDRHFVVELDNDRRAFLRFGDDALGKQPTVGTEFYAKYRIGNGPVGNVGAQSLTWLISCHWQAKLIKSVRNPMAAGGGTDPQSIQEVKLLAPHAYRENQPRAITADDYKRLVLHEFAAEIQDARANIQSAAAGKAVIVAIDPFDSVRNLEDLQRRIHKRLHRVRSIGHHVHVTLAEHVPLDIAMKIHVKDAWRRSLVRLALSELFSNRILSGGRRGLFHPDNVTFGNDIHKSYLVSEAQAVPGVDGVAIIKLQRIGEPPAVKERSNGNGDKEPVVPDTLAIGPLEIARLDNNGSQSKGRLCLELEGGI